MDTHYTPNTAIYVESRIHLNINNFVGCFGVFYECICAVGVCGVHFPVQQQYAYTEIYTDTHPNTGPSSRT